MSNQMFPPYSGPIACPLGYIYWDGQKLDGGTSPEKRNWMSLGNSVTANQHFEFNRLSISSEQNYCTNLRNYMF